MQVSSHEAHAWIKESLGQRSDIGLTKAIVNTLFDPPAPSTREHDANPKQDS
jgi:hypothetical protein